VEYALERMREIPGLRVFGPEGADRSGVVSFEIQEVHPHDMAQVLNDRGIAVRAGHHCNQPLMRRLGLGATTRASFYIYNDRADVDALCDGVAAAVKFFGG
jgi:cysteine desulfurase/selenocysteine lyase